MAKKETVEIIDGKLCVGITRLNGIAEKIYLSELSEPHKTAELTKAGMPVVIKNKERLYPVEDVFEWYSKNRLEIDELKGVKLQSEIDRTKAQTQKINFDYKVAKKEFVSVKEVSQSQAELITFLKNQDMNSLREIPDKKDRKRIEAHYKKKWDAIGKELERIKDSELDSNA